MKVLLYCFISLVYASLLASFPMEGVVDRANYLDMAVVSPLILVRYVGQGIVTVFTNEPVWLLTNSLLNLVLEPENVVRVIIFFSAFTCSFVVLKHNPKAFWFLLFVLFVPQIVKNFISHLRQGMAIAVFMLAWFSPKPWQRVILFMLTPLIHSSFFIVLGILFACNMIKKFRFALDLSFIAYSAIGIVLGFGISLISAMLGARQSETLLANYAAGGSGIGFLFWGLILLIFLLQGRQFSQQHGFSIAMILFYLTVYFVSPIAGRVFESAVLVVVISIWSLTHWRKMAAMLLYILFSSAMLVSNLGKPLLGFSAEL
jgi:hypothetical protein